MVSALEAARLPDFVSRSYCGHPPGAFARAPEKHPYMAIAVGIAGVFCVSHQLPDHWHQTTATRARAKGQLVG